MDSYSKQQKDSHEDLIKSEGTDTNAKNLKAKFAQLYSISNLFERQHKLIEASHQQNSYEPEEYCRLFEAYSQQRIRQLVSKRLTQSIGIASSLAIIFGLVTFILEAAGRKQQLQASAWQLITSHEKTVANAGRKEALEYLNSPSRWSQIVNFFKVNKSNDDRVILSGLQVPGAHLSLVKLRKAKLQGANFQGATLYQADFSEANLYASNLAKTDLLEAILAGANLEKANLGDADLTNADLLGSCLRRANLRGTYIKSLDISKTDFTGAIYDSVTNIQGLTTSEAITDPKKPDKPEREKGMILIGEGRNLSNKDLREANLQAAILRNTKLNGAYLQGADLAEADLQNADLTGANLFRVRNLKKEQILLAANWEKAYYGNDELRKSLELEAEKRKISLRNPREFRFSGQKIPEECNKKK